MSAAVAPGPRLASRASRLRPSAIREILKVTASPEVISFAGGLPAPELFPADALRQAADETFVEDGRSALQYSITEGFLPLREWVCEHLFAACGLRVPPEQVLITHGSQQGLDLAAKVLVDPGDVVLVENPAYLGALQCFGAYEARVVGVAADAEGIRPDALRSALGRSRIPPKLLYLIPNFQNPSGTTLSAARRAQVAELAAAFGVPVLEDDPYGRLRYEGEAAPALAAMPAAADWIHLGSASKTVSPGLRVGWLAASSRLLAERLVSAKQATDLHTCGLTQRIAWRYLRRPDALARHVERLCAAYRSRRDAMLAALERHLPGCRWNRPSGGMFLWGELPKGCDATRLLMQAARRKVAFVPGEPFWVGEPRRETLRLNFSNTAEAAIEEGIARLGAALGDGA